MTTVADIVAGGLQDSGIIGQGQTASASDSANGLRLLRQLVAQWNRKRWLLFHLIDVPLTSTGAVSYTVGAGGAFNTPRPDRLEDGCYFRQLNTAPNLVDYPLTVIRSREDYDRITLKTMGTWPAVIFLDSDYPLGSVYVWPVPAAGQFEIHLLLKSQLASITGASQTLNLPPEYEAALNYNLQRRLRAAYRMPADSEINALAKDALNTVRGANVQIPTLRMPGAVTGHGRSYNVFSDT